MADCSNNKYVYCNNTAVSNTACKPKPCSQPTPCPPWPSNHQCQNNRCNKLTPCPQPCPTPTPCPQPTPCPCPNPCPQPNPNNCDAVLAEFHKLIKESEVLYVKADEIVQVEVLGYVCRAIMAMGQALDMKIMAGEIRAKANLLLDQSNCSFNCNKDSATCKALECQSQEFYNLENKELVESLRLLEEVACKLEKAKYYDSEGDRYEAEYVKCVHNTNC